jgi:hypothetical protein
LPNAAFAGRHRDDVSHAFDHELLAETAAFRHFRVHRHVDRDDTRQAADDLAGRCFHFGFHGTCGGRKHDAKRDVSACDL